MPIVDVLLPVYNGEQYLEECILGIARDAVPNFVKSRVIIVDDGSTDKSLSIAYDLKEKFREELEIIPVPCGVNGGIAAALTIGLQYCNSEIVYRMDVDDVWLKGRFQQQFDLLSNSDAGILGGAAISTINETRFGAFLPEQVKLLDFAVGSPCIHPTIAFKKSFLVEREYLAKSPFDDYVFLLDNVLHGVNVINSNIPLIKYSDEKSSGRLSVQNETLLHVRFLRIRMFLLCFFITSFVSRPTYVDKKIFISKILHITNEDVTKNTKLSDIFEVFLNKVLSKILRFIFCAR